MAKIFTDSEADELAMEIAWKCLQHIDPDVINRWLDHEGEDALVGVYSNLNKRIHGDGAKDFPPHEKIEAAWATFNSFKIQA